MPLSHTERERVFPHSGSETQTLLGMGSPPIASIAPAITTTAAGPAHNPLAAFSGHVEEAPHRDSGVSVCEDSASATAAPVGAQGGCKQEGIQGMPGLSSAVGVAGCSGSAGASLPV